MQSMSRFSAVLGAVAFAVVSAACSNTADGVKKDAANAGDAAANATANAGAAADSAGNKMGDAASNAADAAHAAKQTADIKTAFAADTRLDAGDINIDSDGSAKTVTLNGHVKTEAQKTLASQIAAEKAEGYKVVNNLTVTGK